MAPKKKRGGGRVTSRGPGSGPAAHSRSPGPSARYTPAKADYRVRPRWHRLAGWGVAVGVVIAALNDAMLLTNHVTLLPLGHNEFYLMLAILVAGSATWFLGLFDRGTTIFR